ncbi:hypothetical protein [Algicella marina]|uniref:Uncharacterized protein n=1 Tax=Algicella marina TaxID=2683284 RepID=A0A6P1SUU1_9RHOB|nr:hypothetical protein [Algicella marina]QHQ34218.1 hypothetical protein GO499_02940 [Algicella marina]
MKRALLLALTLLISASARAEAVWYDYRNWTVIVETVDTGEDLRVTCTARTGGDGLPTLKLEVSNGDALPPGYYPEVALEESAIRGYPTVMNETMTVYFETDSGWKSDAGVAAWRDDEGFAHARAVIFGGSAANLALLREMRQAGKLWVTSDGEVIHAASLAGFTAAYGKVAEQCGFSAADVTG